MAVAITLVSAGNTSGGNIADTITTAEYATSAAADTAITTKGTLPVTTPVAADGTALKSRNIPVAAIKQIVTL